MSKLKIKMHALKPDERGKVYATFVTVLVCVANRREIEKWRHWVLIGVPSGSEIEVPA